MVGFLNWSRASEISAVSREVPMTKELLTFLCEMQGINDFYCLSATKCKIMIGLMHGAMSGFEKLISFSYRFPNYRSSSRLCLAAKGMDPF